MLTNKCFYIIEYQLIQARVLINRNHVYFSMEVDWLLKENHIILSDALSRDEVKTMAMLLI